ncbi:uncharacterized protein LOC134204398 [Armigeres subalbatus]|uniref:uncharacterized protein LOC134204398 n=1 Tax=Armigeres subalbatus TaxID=124917 RepID=UPI002ED42135
MMDHCIVTVLLLLMAGRILCNEKFAVVCRIGDVSAVKDCDQLHQCLYEVHPVEMAQFIGGPHSMSCRNKLFSLYGGPSSCGYFGNLINCHKGRKTLVETVQKQLQKSGFRGVDFQCDPGLPQINQQDYADFLTLLRKEIGSGYVISVVLQSVNIEPSVVTVLCDVVDLITIPLNGCVSQIALAQNLIGQGVSRLKILLDVTLPEIVSCPLDSGVNNLFWVVQNTVNVIDNQQLLGATIQLDRDDTAGVCAKGRYPLFTLLNSLLKRCEVTTYAPPVFSTPAPCNFKGYIRDTRDCSSFHSCNNGITNKFQCPPGLAFDLCSSTCQPVVQVNCDSNSCTLTGAVNGGCQQIPIPIPYPILNPGSCQGNYTGCNSTCGGSNSGGSDECLNITSIFYLNNQTSALLDLLDNTQLEGTLQIVNSLTGDLQKALGGIVGQVNNLLSSLLLHDDAIGGTLGQMDQMQKQMGLLEKLLKAVLDLLNNLLGLNLLGGGGGGGGGLPGAGAVGALGGLAGKAAPVDTSVASGATGALSARVMLAQDYDVACRIEDPTKEPRCKVLKKCTYRVYPVESIQTKGGRSTSNCAGFTDLFSMYSGSSACGYFSNMIGTTNGCSSFTNIVKRQLEKSDFRGVDLQCDPTMNGVNETTYSCCLHQLRETVGRGYIIGVRIENPNLGTVLVSTLNAAVDVVNCPLTSVVQSLIAQGLSSRKIVIDVTLPSVINCPTEVLQLQNISSTVRCLNLFGAILQLDRDDSSNVCGEGSYPLLNRLSVLLEEKEPCDFEGFIPNPRDRSQFFSCSNGDHILHQCPPGQLFDRMNGTCIPFLRVLCNQTACTFTGPVQITNDTKFLPVPIPYPTDTLPTRKPRCNYNNYLEVLKKLLNLTASNETIRDAIQNLKQLNDSMGNIVIVLNNTNGSYGSEAMTKNQNNMDKFGEKLGLLEALLKTVNDLIKKVTGLDLGLFSSPAGAAGLPGLPVGR